MFMLGLNSQTFLVSSIVLLVVTSGSLALANEDTDTARALFTEARRLTTEGQYERACPLFEKSLKLESGIGTQFNLADCCEHVGRNASAYELFQAVAAAAKEKVQPERERVATARAEALLPKLSRLQVKSDSTVKNIRVSRNDVTLAEHQWRDPTPVDPGIYTVVSVSKDNKELWKTQVTVPPQALTVIVAVPPTIASTTVLMDTSYKVPPKPTTSGSSERRLHQTAPPLVANGKTAHDSSGYWPAIGLLAGSAGLATGTIFALLFQSKNGQARDTCPTSMGCTDAEIRTHDSLVSDAKTARTGAYIAFGLGAASVTAATIFYISKPANREKPPAAAMRIGPVLGTSIGSYWGAAAQGSW
jgi:hypothetical protein